MNIFHRYIILFANLIIKLGYVNPLLDTVANLQQLHNQLISCCPGN